MQQHEVLRTAFSTPTGHRDPLDDIIMHILKVARAHLGMDVAFLNEFVGDQGYFRWVDLDSGDFTINVGPNGLLENGYCIRVSDGRFPNVMQDTSRSAEAMSLDFTSTLPVGSYISVPIRLSNGTLYGAFCCFSHGPTPSLNERDTAVMRALADILAEQIESKLLPLRELEAAIGRIRRTIELKDFSVVYQPIVGVDEKTMLGVESLSRFASQPPRGPDVWFSEATKVGLGVELELVAARKALAGMDQLPSVSYVAINASPQTILSREWSELLAGSPLDRIVLEVTEHAIIDDYDVIGLNLEPLRKKGLRLAVDDAGAGFASLRHILYLHPDLIKLDMSLTRDIDRHTDRRALASAMVSFANEIGSLIVAEGVETREELHTLRDLGVGAVQGYLLSKPLPLDRLQGFLQDGGMKFPTLLN